MQCDARTMVRFSMDAKPGIKLTETCNRKLGQWCGWGRLNPGQHPLDPMTARCFWQRSSCFPAIPWFTSFQSVWYHSQRLLFSECKTMFKNSFHSATCCLPTVGVIHSSRLAVNLYNSFAMKNVPSFVVYYAEFLFNSPVVCVYPKGKLLRSNTANAANPQILTLNVFIWRKIDIERIQTGTFNSERVLTWT